LGWVERYSPPRSDLETVIDDGLTDALGQAFSHLLLRAAADHQKLVATPTDQGVGLPAGVAEDVSHLDENEIPGRVAVDVVDLFEAVEVEQQEEKVGFDRRVVDLAGEQAGVETVDLGDVGLDAGQQITPVAQTGEGVGVARLLELFVHELEGIVFFGQLLGSGLYVSL
jgi:hypothetical protein